MLLTAKTPLLNQKAVQLKLGQDSSGEVSLYACPVLSLLKHLLPVTVRDGIMGNGDQCFHTVEP